MKKFLKLICIIILGIIVTIGCTNKKNVENIEEKPIKENNDMKNEESINIDKSLVLYFSATGTTKEVANKIAEVTNLDLEEIVPKEKYTNEDLSYNNDDCRANKEQNNVSARPEIENKINIENYDVIFLGYPIWWGTTPKIILSLLDSYNFENKIVIPFCTSGSSSITKSVEDLKEYNSKIKFLEGKRFNRNVTTSEITTWVDSLNIN